MKRVLLVALVMVSCGKKDVDPVALCRDQAAQFKFTNVRVGHVKTDKFDDGVVMHTVDLEGNSEDGFATVPCVVMDGRLYDFVDLNHSRGYIRSGKPVSE